MYTPGDFSEFRRRLIRAPSYFLHMQAIVRVCVRHFEVIFQKRVRVFHRGFQTQENR